MLCYHLGTKGNTNNLAEVLQTLKDLIFMLANRAPELAGHYNMALEPCQIRAEEVPDLVKAHLHSNTAYNPEHSIRGRPHSRGNKYHQYSQQSSLLLRYNQQSERLDTHLHSNRNYGNTHHCIISQCNSPRTVRNTPNTSSNQANTITTQSLKQLRYNRMFTKSVLGLQTQALQQSMVNTVNIFDGNNKSEFTFWVQSVENAAKLCNLNTLSITLSKLQGPPLKSAHFLESKEISSGKQLDWQSLIKHLTTNYSEIPYDTHSINAYDNLHQGSDESTSTYLHRVQDILEHIHHTSDMTSISTIGTNHAKILTGLKDSRLQNKLAKSKTKKWTTMSQVLHDIVDMATDFKRLCGYSFLTFKAQYVSSTNSSSSYRSNRQAAKSTQQPSACQEKPKCWHCQGEHYKKDCPTVPSKVPPQNTNPPRKCSMT